MDVDGLFWDEAREFYQALRRRKAYSYRETARRAGLTTSAVSRFFDPRQTYTRIPPVVDKLDAVFELPRGHGRDLLIEGKARPVPAGPVMADLDQIRARVETADHLSGPERAELLARIEDIRAARFRQEAELHRIRADLLQAIEAYRGPTEAGTHAIARTRGR